MASKLYAHCTRKWFLNQPYICHYLKSNLSSVYTCIIGSGPAGFYCAQHLLKLLPTIFIDIYEKWPVPFGLIRYGVAPDHPEVKNVINTFSKIALNERVRFIGNVTLGKNVSLKELQNSYHIVILAYGTEEDIKLEVSGEHLKNVISARDFVGWYNGLPDARNIPIDLTRSDKVIIVGQGNVALDVARILLKSPDELKHTDITEHSLSHLVESKVKHIYLVGRRGPLQVAYTVKEFREMTKLSDVATLFRKEQMDGIDIAKLHRPRKRLTELMVKVSSECTKMRGKTFNLVFLRSPLNIRGIEFVNDVEFSVNYLETDIVKSTDEREILPCGLLLRSIGYKSISVDPDISVNKFGYVETDTLPENVYSTGWLSTGPTGVILSTMSTAFQTADSILKDVTCGKINVMATKAGFEEIKVILQRSSCHYVSWTGWEKIDSTEIQRGKRLGKVREKIVDIKEMLEIGTN